MAPRNVLSRYVVFAAIAVLVMSMQQILASPSQAVGCGGMPLNVVGPVWRTQGGSQPRSFIGSKAIILDRPGYSLCTTNPSTQVWTGVEVGGDTTGYSLAGTSLDWNSGYCVKRFAEMTQGHGIPINTFYLGGCSQPGEAHFFWNQYIWVAAAGAYRIRANYDLTVIHQSAFDPYLSFWDTPFHVAFQARGYHPQNTIPGSPSHPLEMSGMEVQDSTNLNWYNACGSASLSMTNSNWPQSQTDALACNHVRFWTQ